jgi:hypothetical protein
MNFPRRYLYYISINLFLIFFLFSLRQDSNFNFNKKVVFDAIREENGLYFLKNGRVEFIEGSQDVSFPKWSPDGKFVAGVKENSIIFYDTYKKNFVKKLNFSLSFFNAEVAQFVWQNDGKSIYAFLKTYKNNFYEYILVKYDLELKKSTTILKFDRKNAKFVVKNLSISPDSKFLIFYAGDEEKYDKLFVIDLELYKVSFLIEKAIPISWLPQKDGFLFFYINSRYRLGYIKKLDFYNNKIVSNLAIFNFSLCQNLNLSKDGKCLYYSKRNIRNTYNIVYSKIYNNKISLEKNITNTVYINDKKGFSNDMFADLF